MNLNGFDFYLGDKPPKKSGVYVVERNGSVVYVGSSSNIYMRICQHKSTGMVICGDDLHFHLSPIYDARDIESSIISLIRPEFNIKDNPDKPKKEKNKFPVTRMLTSEQIKHSEQLSKSKGLSQSEVIGIAVSELFYRDCAEREGVSFESWMESMKKGEF